ncbi:hypothetical protein BY996DRAFT_6488887 [Phakopsora pachyrhizi]|nr:hypothetical protein BY996DRAFT_6488887 [Phakopsora pachyrhizi]
MPTAGAIEEEGGSIEDELKSLLSVIQNWVGIAMRTVLGGYEEFSKWGGAAVVADLATERFKKNSQRRIRKSLVID